MHTVQIFLKENVTYGTVSTRRIADFMEFRVQQSTKCDGSED